MKISDITPKDIFKSKLSGEPIFANMESAFDFSKLIELKLLVPSNELVSHHGMEFTATHTLIIKGLGVSGEAHLRENDTFTIKIT